MRIFQIKRKKLLVGRLVGGRFARVIRIYATHRLLNLFPSWGRETNGKKFFTYVRRCDDVFGATRISWNPSNVSDRAPINSYSLSYICIYKYINIYLYLYIDLIILFIIFFFHHNTFTRYFLFPGLIASGQRVIKRMFYFN